MPRSTKSQEDLLVSMMADEIITSADEMARGSGGPAGSEQPTSREELDIWGRTDPAVNYDVLLQRLMSGGIPPEEAQQFKLVQVYPQLAPAFEQPKSPQHAETLARMAEYPFRHTLYEHLDPKDRVTYAERLDRDYQRSQPVSPETIDMSVMGG